MADHWSLYGPLYGLPDPHLSQDLLSNASTEVVREALTNRRTSLRIEVLAVNALSNATLPINALPSEIFVHIFHLARPDNLDGDDEAAALQVQIPPIPRVGSYHWVPLMLVCRHWRAVALASYCLWHFVDVEWKMRPLEIALERSAIALVDVAIHAPIPSFYGPLPLIETHRARFRRLHLSVCEPPHSFLEMFHQPLPALRELTLTIEFQAVHPLYGSDQVLRILGRKGDAMLAFDLCPSSDYANFNFMPRAMVGLGTNFSGAPPPPA
ncbi:hypothetical protein GY45DRAFT_1430488 [Cubamyces sp. BRFM 1775]|nr:hypothetical protein GY45DRAFT_1430488 [Cubamyces sp. BRFM 1775]